MKTNEELEKMVLKLSRKVGALKTECHNMKQKYDSILEKYKQLERICEDIVGVDYD